MNNNPFITSGYVSPEYFCDREEETNLIINDIYGRSNMLLMSPRRMGKTGLIQHCFYQNVIKDNYYCFFIDIYATLNIEDFITLLGNKICDVLNSKGRNLMEKFCQVIRSLEFRIGFDDDGTFGASIAPGEIKNPERTLDEIFDYLDSADKPCVVAIDEFQQIGKYPQKNIEALLRTHIQHCTNAVFIFAGSQRHLLSNMFFSAAKPFYQSSSVMNLKQIPLEKYSEFVRGNFINSSKSISSAEIDYVYNLFNGHTWYMQCVFYTAFYMTQDICSHEIILAAIKKRVDDNGNIYESLLYSIPEKQQKLLKAIALEDDAIQIQSAKFIKKYQLASASSVQSAAKKLLDRDLITEDKNVYRINDHFFKMWMRK